jgi:hypothetical protein
MDFIDISSEEEEEHVHSITLTHDKRSFVKLFNHYMSQSKDRLMDEFVGDRVFNLEVARRLSLTGSVVVAKGAIGIYTSNKVMSEAMATLGLIPVLDMLSSDLEVTCSIAYRLNDYNFINKAVQYVIEYGVASTGYDDKWFEDMGNRISRKEKNRHGRVGAKFVYNTTIEPVGQLLGLLRSNAMVEPVFTYKQTGTGWIAETTFMGILFSAFSSTKSESKKSVSVKILRHLEHVEL